MTAAITRPRFANGPLDDVASVLCASSERAAQYLEQAPVLAVLTCGTLRSHITYGELDRFKVAVEASPKLKHLLAAYGGVFPMRKLSANALKVSDEPALRALAKLDPSSLSQFTPTDSQRIWLDGIHKWLRLMPGGKKARERFSVAWIAHRLGENLSRFEQVDVLIDFLHRGRGELNERWSWERALEEVQAWHRRLNDDRALARALGDAKRAAEFDKVICSSRLPSSADVDGYGFEVLRTMRQLREEGVAMHHCVASYASDVRKGKCAIVSVQREGVRVATLEVNSKGSVAQLKAHCNQAVLPALRSAAETYVLLHWRPPVSEAA